MAELLLELYSEEIPPQLQIDARTQLKDLITKHLRHQTLECFLVFTSTKYAAH